MGGLTIPTTFIIAEAGVNHNGSIDIAKKLIDVATDAKCDAVKFQTFKAENLVLSDAKKCDYQVTNTGSFESQFEMIKKLELPFSFHEELIDYAIKRGIVFLSTPFDIESAEYLNSLDMKIFKIPSGEINNTPYLEKINSFNKDVILSTGMSTIKEIKFALNILKDCNVSILHCNSQYPTDYCDVNLLAMLQIKKITGKRIGYSDHTLGIEVPIAAVALGAEIVEKHITLNKKMSGPDHAASIEPYELKNMVKSIRNIEKSLGSGIKKPTPSELININHVRKSIVAKTFIKKGDIFSADNLSVKRPAGGISPSLWYNIIGIPSNKDYKKNDFIIMDNSEYVKI